MLELECNRALLTMALISGTDASMPAFELQEDSFSCGSRIYKRGRGAKVERHRREDRGAEGGGVGCGEGVFFDFGSQNGDFRCILDTILYCSCRRRGVRCREVFLIFGLEIA